MTRPTWPAWSASSRRWPIFAAIPLNKLVAEFINVVGRFGRSATLARTGRRSADRQLASLLGFLGRENFTDYYTAIS